MIAPKVLPVGGGGFVFAGGCGRCCGLPNFGLILFRSFSARSLSLEAGASSKSHATGFGLGCDGRGGTGLRKAVPAGAMALARMLLGFLGAGFGAIGDEAATCTTGREAGDETSDTGERSMIWVGWVTNWVEAFGDERMGGSAARVSFSGESRMRCTGSVSIVSNPEGRRARMLKSSSSDCADNAGEDIVSFVTRHLRLPNETRYPKERAALGLTEGRHGYRSCVLEFATRSDRRDTRRLPIEVVRTSDSTVCSRFVPGYSRWPLESKTLKTRGKNVPRQPRVHMTQPGIRARFKLRWR